jgi:hypothetical protein
MGIVLFYKAYILAQLPGYNLKNDTSQFLYDMVFFGIRRIGSIPSLTSYMMWT